MKDQLELRYSTYGQYINRMRAFPLILDGCKIVEKRLLYSLYEKARERFVKSATVVGHCIGNYHPHGDVSAYQSLVTLVRSGLAVGQGNFGISVGVNDEPAAAQRYTEVKSSGAILDLAFEHIKYVRKEALEIYEEPVFLPTKLPLCLIGAEYRQGIGFGSRTVIPTYKAGDLVRRLKWLLTQEGPEPVIRPRTSCHYISTNEQFKELLTTGKAKIEYRGLIENSNSTREIIVRSIPPSKSFVSILKSMEKQIEVEKSIGWLDESTTQTRVRFNSLKRSMPFTKLSKIVNNQLVGSMSFQCNMCDLDGNIVLVSVDDMLLNIYKNYKKINGIVIQDAIDKIDERVKELEILAIIKKHLPKWLRSHPDNADAVITGVATDGNLEVAIVKKLFDKYTISRILKLKTDIAELMKDRAVEQSHLDNLESFIWTEKYEKYLPRS